MKIGGSKVKRLLKRYSREEKEAFCVKWRESGLNQSEFCRQNSLNPMTFNGWVKKFQSRGESGFIPVLVSDKEEAKSSSEFLEIKIAGKITIKVPTTTEESLIARILNEVIKCI